MSWFRKNTPESPIPFGRVVVVHGAALKLHLDKEGPIGDAARGLEAVKQKYPYHVIEDEGIPGQSNLVTSSGVTVYGGQILENCQTVAANADAERGGRIVHDRRISVSRNQALGQKEPRRGLWDRLLKVETKTIVFERR